LYREGSKQARLAASILLFLIVFGLWQVHDLIITHFSLPSWVISYGIFYLIIWVLCLAAFALFVKLGKSSFGEHGFKKPINIGRCVSLSIFSIVIFLIIITVPGFMFEFTSPTIRLTVALVVFNVANAVLASLATESIFRGYIFKNLLKNHGFFTSLYASSILFSLHQVSINNMLAMSHDQLVTYIFTDIAPLFAAGLFLGYLFYKTQWSLLGPVIFRAGYLLYFFFPLVLATMPWWVNLTFIVSAYAILIIFVDSAIKEPIFLRKKYGL